MYRVGLASGSGVFYEIEHDQTELLDVHFRGVSEGQDGRTEWVRGITPAHGTLATHRPWRDEREFVHDEWSVPTPRVGQLYQLKMRAMYFPLAEAGNEAAAGSAVDRRIKKRGARF